MSSTLFEVVEKYVLDDSGHTAGSRRVQANTRANAAAFDQANAGFDRFRTSLKSGLDGLGGTLTVATAALAAVFAAGGKAYGDYAEFDSLRKALESVEGSAGAASASIDRLRTIARQPGLGVDEAIGGYLQLRNAGADQGFAEGLVKEFGNAVARGGGGKEQLAAILRQVSQSLNKPFLQGEELSVIAEAGVPAYKLLQKRFGTSDSEELKKRGIGSEEAIRGLLAELAALPRVSGGAKNSIENLQDTLGRFSIGVGAGLAGAGPGLDSFSEALARVTDSGAVTSAVAGFADSMASLLATVTGGEASTDGLTDSMISALAALQTFGIQADAIGTGLIQGFENVANALIAILSALLGPLGYVFAPAIVKAGFKGAIGEDVEDTYASTRAALQAQVDGDRKVRAKKEFRDKWNDDPYGDPAEDPGDKKAMAKALADDQKKLDGPQSDLPKIVTATERTARATERFSQMAEMVLGGGVVGQAGLSLHDLSGIKGSGGRDDVRGLLMQVADAWDSVKRSSDRNRRPRYSDVG